MATIPAAAAVRRGAGPEQAPARYTALDAMRGLVMLVLVSGGFGLGALIKDPRYQRLASNFHHLDWDGLIVWELIMPSFVFMVGASLPFALARRAAAGAAFGSQLKHVAWRTAKLILLGQFLTTLHAGHYRYEPYETLTQLGLSYFTAFLVLQLRPRLQVSAAAGLMALNWGLYALFPGSQGPFSPTDNIGVAIDRAVFGLDHAGSWATINFIGSAVTVLAGAWTARLLMGARPHREKLQRLLLAVAGCVAAGLALAPVDPVIHKAWTASFTFLHTGIILAVIAAFFWLFDMQGRRKAAFPLVVVGMNSIFIYMLSQTARAWIDRSLAAFTYRFAFLGGIGPAVQACAVAAAMWCACYWLYRRRIFFRV